VTIASLAALVLELAGALGMPYSDIAAISRRQQQKQQSGYAMTLAEDPKAGPVSGAARFGSIDTLRGVALLGILLMNIIGFALPIGAYFSPVVDGATDGINLLAYGIIDTFFEGSMRTIFSILFGAGVILFTAKPDTGEIPIADLWFRRTMLLIMFGVFDGYVLLWFGDILYHYGIAGLFLYVFRNASPRRLLALSAMIMVVMAGIQGMGSRALDQLHQGAIAAGQVSEDARSQAQIEAIDAWEAVRADAMETPEIAAMDIEARQGGYLAAMDFIHPVTFYLETEALYTAWLWDVLSMMFLGMALFKWGVLTAERSLRFYATMAVVGLAVGLSVNYLEVRAFIDSGFATHLNMSNNRPSYDIGRLFTAFGYIGLVMLICKLQLFTLLRTALAAVGRMALTNYLSHSVICAIVFYGFGLVGQLERHQIYYVVLAIWAFQLIASPIWLQRYRFGPVEWLWRSLTYGERQPMRRPTVAEPAGAAA
jgi:uncharacterized protein